MNTRPIVRNAHADGGQAERNRAAAFWQSRHPTHQRIPLVDLRELARAIRRSHP